MNLDEYMVVLQQRADEAMATQRGTGWAPRFPPLLTWFVRDEDVDVVELPTPEPKPEPKPRYYRPASYWRDRIARLQARMRAVGEPLIPDRAAAGGAALGPKRTARIQQAEDGRLGQYVALRKELEHAQHMLRSAERREADNP